MKTKNSLRIKLGLSQEQMAEYLGVDRSLLAHYEVGKRDLPTKALLKMSALKIEIIQLQKETNADTEIKIENKIETKDALEKYVEKCLLEANILANKLASLKQKNEMIDFQMVVFSALLAKLDQNDKKYAFEKLQLELWLENIVEKKVASETIILLDIRIKALQFEAQLAQKYFE